MEVKLKSREIPPHLAEYFRPVAEVAPGNNMLVPYRIAIALQEAGWIIRQDVVWCLSGGTWIYARTIKGDMPVMLKDLTRLDPKTVQLWNGNRWTKVKSWTKSTDSGDKLELVLRSGERIGCTSSHLWPTQRGNIPASELKVGDVVQACRLDEPRNAVRPDAINNDTLWLVGLYLAEGSRHRKSGAADSLSLALSSDETAWIPRIDSVCKRFGGSCSHSINGGSLTVRLHGRVLVSVIEQYVGGSTAHNKRFTNAVWSLPNSALRHIANGYLDGDGSRDSGNCRWRLGFCRNYSLERDLRVLAARLGAVLTLTPTVASYQGGQRPAFRGEWRWSRSGHHNERDRGEIVEIRKSRARQFWDVEVADEPHLFSLASGVLTHNCKPSPMPESIDGTRWERCRVKVSDAVPPTQEAAVQGLREGRRTKTRDCVGGTWIGGAQWAPCPGCDKCRANNGYVLRRGSWRPTTAHEFVFQIVKSADYFCDAMAAAEPVSGNAHSRGKGTTPKSANGTFGQERNNDSFSAAVRGLVETRNPRSVWTISSEAYKRAHFAAFPTMLAHKCIQAATSSAGCCPDCGAQYAPIVEKGRVPTRPGEASKFNEWKQDQATAADGQRSTASPNRDPQRHVAVKRTTGYRPTCDCDAGEPVPCTVADPFTGSGTTLQVAINTGRQFVGSEIAEHYLPLIQERAETPWAPKDQRKPVPKRRKRNRRERSLFT